MTKHNKKRNVGFVYEALVLELTKAITENNKKRKNKVVSILKEHFYKGSLLYSELQHYKDLYEKSDLPKETAKEMVDRVVQSYSNLDQDALFKEQSKLISRVNKELEPTVFKNFVSNYKDLATINQIFKTNTVKKRMMLENKLIESITKKEEEKQKLQLLSNLQLKSFMKKYNDKYKDLLPEQKSLLSKFINNDPGFRYELNEEIERIKDELYQAKKNTEEIKKDKEMVKKVEEVVKRFEEDFPKKEIDSQMMTCILKTQELIKEIHSK